MWFRIPVGRPRVFQPRPWPWMIYGNERLRPTYAYIWDQVAAPFARAKRAYMEYVNEFDTLSASSVTWQPYNAPEYAGMIFSVVCSSEDELYMMQCPLVCFWCVEWHLPHRVQRQFGRNQLWPVEDVPTSKELHKFDRRKQKKITDFRQHHLILVNDWESGAENVYSNDELHNNSDYRRYQAWYQGATRCKLRQQWTAEDYADIDSSDDEETEYDLSTRLGTQVEAAPILDRVGNTLRRSVEDIDRQLLTTGDSSMRSFLQRLSRRLRGAAARCGYRTTIAHDVHVPSCTDTATPSTGLGAGFDYDHDEIGPSQLEGAPSTQPLQPQERRRHRSPQRYTPGTDALGKGKTRRR
ncbi:uncharacterized protein [Zea mays]|uniref:uncharacterized protein n=1 Tax=Zea mays TaxID=4577 RepID=UPI0009A95DA5|nr:uncharacterized protein LOC103646250 [Zea mays]|eukprot:XP_020404845.1 uncharacterized protein LOC103646250 [Zea mays]